VLAVGGKPGEPRDVSGLGVRPSFPSRTSGGPVRIEARELLQQGLEAKPAVPRSSTTSPASRRARRERQGTRALLEQSVAADERFREYAQTDEDLVSIRDDPRFPRPH
jgi:hypothetical protein